MGHILSIFRHSSTNMQFLLVLAGIIAVVGAAGRISLDPNQFCFDCQDRRNHKDHYANPNDCTSYIQCTYGLTPADIQGFVVSCAPGYFFNSAILQCTEDINGDCTDLCMANSAPQCYAQPSQDACSYYTCGNRRSHAQCCPKGTVFELATCGCVRPATPTAACPCQDALFTSVTPFAPTVDLAAQTCTDGYGNLLSAVTTNARQFIYIVGNVQTIMTCSPGTAFQLANAAGSPVCDCVTLDTGNSEDQRKKSCLTFLPFNSNTGFTDMTIYNRFTGNQGTTPVTLTAGGAASTSSAASFNGLNWLELTGLKTFDFRGDASFCYFARCDGAACSSGGLLSNAGRPDGFSWSVRSGMSPDRTLVAELGVFDPENSGRLEATVGNVNTFFHVCQVFANDVYTLYVNGAQADQMNLPGDVAIKHCPFAVGSDQLYGNFQGDIDEVLICDHALSQSDRDLHQAANYAAMISENMIKPCPVPGVNCYA